MRVNSGKPEGIMLKVDDIEKKFLTRDEAALFLGLRPQTLANLTWQNAGPPAVAPGSWTGKFAF